MRSLAVAVVCFWSLVALAEAPPPPKPIALRAARMLDVKRGRIVAHAVVMVEGDKIRAVGENLAPPAGATLIDLGDVTLLPGLIDCHTHLMARMADDPNGYLVALATKSQAYRALEGAANARAALRAGFTTVRDVENEGSGYADVALRDAIAEGLVEGPRMFVATRGIAAVGAYNPFGVSPDLREFPTGAQMVSGVEEARRAAREQLGNGADLLKVYADWDHPTLTVEELRAVVDEAHRAGKKVAAHANSPPGIRNALTAGVDSIEHGNRLDRALLQQMKHKGVFWVPTRGAYAESRRKSTTPPGAQKWLDEVVRLGRDNLALALKLGVKIAAGYDAASAEAQGHAASELIELGQLGMPAAEVVRAATVNAAELVGRPDLGALEAGRAADIIAVDGDPLANLAALAKVTFVMKAGTVVRKQER